MAAKTLYVGNLPYSVTESQCNDLFKEFGGTNARIIEGRGFAFVDVDGDRVSEAIQAKNGTSLDGRTLNVNEARPKTENNNRGGGGGYGGGGRGRY